jgi:hypothetical protein
LNFNSGDFDYIIKLYEASVLLKNTQAAIKTNAKSIAIASVQDSYKVFSNDITLTIDVKDGITTLKQLSMNGTNGLTT